MSLVKGQGKMQKKSCLDITVTLLKVKGQIILIIFCKTTTPYERVKVSKYVKWPHHSLFNGLHLECFPIS